MIPSGLTENLDAQLNEAYATRGSNLPRAIELAEASLKLAIECQDEQLIGKAHNILSLFKVIQCQFDQALHHAGKALPIFTKLDSKKGIADSYYNMASVYYRKDNFHLGLEYLLKCQKLYRELNDHHNLARVNKSMGTVYEYFGDYASAQTAYLNCIEASKIANDKSSESNAYNPLSGLLVKQGLLREAEEMITRGIALKNETTDHRGMGFAIYALGKVYLAHKAFAQAIVHFTQAVDIHQKFGDQLGQAMAFSKISDTYFANQDFEAARDAALKALEIATQSGIELIRFKSYYRLYRIMKQLHESELAFGYLEKYIEAKESVINAQTQNVIKSYSAISEIEKLEQEALAQQEKTAIIEKKNDELDSFFYRVSHDLKGPISSLLGLYELVKLEVKDESALQYLEMYNSQTLRINNIVMGLIDLINLRNEYPKTKINFTELVDDCVQSCFYLEKFTSVKIIKEIDPDIELYSEWAIVSTILQNLIENAIKYSRDGVASYVRIGVCREESKAIIVVEDNGEGIAPAIQSNVFNMFVRGTTRQTGTGLGLYILNRAVERLHGTISLESKIMEGSTFTISIPLVAQ